VRLYWVPNSWWLWEYRDETSQGPLRGSDEDAECCWASKRTATTRMMGKKSTLTAVYETQSRSLRITASLCSNSTSGTGLPSSRIGKKEAWSKKTATKRLWVIKRRSNRVIGMDITQRGWWGCEGAAGPRGAGVVVSVCRGQDSKEQNELNGIAKGLHNWVVSATWALLVIKTNSREKAPTCGKTETLRLIHTRELSKPQRLSIPH